MKHAASIIMMVLTMAAAGYAAETMLDYFKGRLPATKPRAASDKIPIMQGNGSAIRMVEATEFSDSDHQHSPISYNPSTLTVQNGTLDAGVVGDLSAIGGTLVTVSEASGSPALRVQLTYTGAVAVNNITFNGRYQGGAGHEIAVQAWNVTTSAWDTLGLMATATANQWYSYPIINGADYISSGTVLIRFEHIQSGVPSHDLYLDYAVARYASDSTAGGVTDHGSLTGLTTHDDHTQYALANGTRGTLPATSVTGLASVATSGSYNDLSNKPTIPDAQVNSDWNAGSGVAQILNKPSLSAVATSGSYADLSGKPSLATVATSGSYTDLSNTPSIPSAAANISYTNPTYPTVAAALDQLLYVAPDVSGITNNRGTLEVGTSISDVLVSWSLNKTMTTLSINRPTDGLCSSPGCINANAVNYTHTRTFTPTSQTTNTYTVTVGDGTNTDAASTSVYWYWRRHYEASTVPLASFTSANILSMASSGLSTSHTLSTTYNCTGGRYPTFAFPTTFGLLNNVTVGGLSFSDYSYRTISHTNALGVTTNYYVYQFNSLQTGAAINVSWD